MRRRDSILIKALALVLTVSTVLFSSLFGVMYHRAMRLHEQQALQGMETRLEMLCAYLDVTLTAARNTNYQFMQSGLMNSEDEAAIAAYFRSYSEIGGVTTVKFLLEGDRVLGIDRPVLLSSLHVDAAFFYRCAQRNRLALTGPYYSPLAAGRVVALVRSIIDASTGRERLLVLEIRTPNLIEQMLEKLSRQEAVVILTPDGDTVYMNFYSTILGTLAANNSQLDIGDEIRSRLSGLESGVHEIMVGEERLLVQRTRYSQQWSVYYLAGAEWFYDGVRAAAKQYLLIGAAGVMALLTLGAFISFGLTRPVKKLARQVDALPADNPDAQLPVTRHDEIGSLAQSFNHLLMRLRKASEEKAESERSRYQLEYKVLQSQIQPHFLFNTHMCVFSLLEQGKNEEARALLTDLDALLRASTDKYCEMLTLREEIELLLRYVSIQHARRGDTFDVIVAPYEPWGEMLLPKLLLQPIVENAIYHGLADLPRRGEIRIDFDEIDSLLHITVEDNGCGMSRERLAQVAAGQGGSKQRGMVSIGLDNVRQRILSFYGRDCGLYVNSREGIGTAVEIVIRKV